MKKNHLERKKYNIGGIAILSDRERKFFILVLSKLQFDSANMKHAEFKLKNKSQTHLQTPSAIHTKVILESIG